jgi:hypothetical protein
MATYEILNRLSFLDKISSKVEKTGVKIKDDPKYWGPIRASSGSEILLQSSRAIHKSFLPFIHEVLWKALDADASTPVPFEVRSQAFFIDGRDSVMHRDII